MLEAYGKGGYHKDSYVDEDDECSHLLKTVADYFDKEDRMTRERQIRHWRRLKLYWNNFSQIYWSEVAHDYRIYNRDVNATDTDQDYYDKPVNIFKAFLETIIAALSVQIPAIACVPDDADSTLDISTAKAGDEIAELIYKHNDVIFLWLHALYIYCTEGLIACHNYEESSKEFGTYDKPKWEMKEEEGYVCKQCGSRIPDELVEDDEFDPDEDDKELQPCSSCTMFLANENRCTIHGPNDDIQPDYTCDYYEEGEPSSEGDQPTGQVTKEQSNYRPAQTSCIECGAPIGPDMQKSKLKIRRQTGITKEAKTRIGLKVYGGLYVKVANYAKEQSDTPYLIFSHETHYANAMECYPKLRERIPQGGWTNVGVTDPYEQYARLNTQYRGEFPDDNVTVKECWLRPASFNILEEEDCKYLKKKFPHGARFVMVNDVCAEYEDECLDDHWTLTQNPMSDYLNHDPLGELLTNIQDIINDLISLTLQTVEHGIAQTYADPAVVNFSAQKQIEAMPGTITPTKPLAGTRNIKDAFFTSQLASLSPEVISLYKIVQELGQFVSGALPSIFGGQLPAGSSRTASEYSTSKGMALQRLQTPWRMMTIWWKKIFAKVIPMYMKHIHEDERIVKKNDTGKFVNVFIRVAELAGTIGSFELEPDEKLPITDEQKADMIIQLLTLNNQQITSAIMDPENLPYIAKVIKIPEFHLPGEDDREKQNEEIDELVNSTPTPPSQQSILLYQQALKTGHPGVVQPQPQTSIPIDVDVDNHAEEAQVCKEWLISEAGRLAKKQNPDGYQNVLLHMKEHLAEVQKGIKAQMLHDDQLKLAGVKDKQKTSDEPKGLVPAAKPTPSENPVGANNGQ